MNKEFKWYDKSWVMWLLLIFVPYIGIIFMWVNKKDYDVKKKFILTIVFGIYTLAIFVDSQNMDVQLTDNQSTAYVSDGGGNNNQGIDKDIQGLDSSNQTIDLNNIRTVSDIDIAYSENLTNIMNKVKLKEIDDLTYDIVIERAAFAANLVIGDTSNSYISGKIDTVEKLVSLDDFSNNTDVDTFKSLAIYMIEKWDDGAFISYSDNELYQNLYITRYLDKVLLNFPEYYDLSRVNFDMYQITKDKLRIELNSEALGSSIEENTIQINKYLASAKELLGMETEVIIRQDWIDKQFSIWNGSHIQLEVLIIKNLNDEESYEHIETTYIDISSTELQETINNILITNGYTKQVEIDDLFITTKFSAKNSFNATIKSTAIGVVKYASNTIELICIE